MWKCDKCGNVEIKEVRLKLI